MSDARFPHRPLNGCGACKADFASMQLFDAHRVGKHAFIYSEGLRMQPPREDGRRCLDLEEMLEKGWELNDRGRWSDPAATERARMAFRRLPDDSPALGGSKATHGSSAGVSA